MRLYRFLPLSIVLLVAISISAPTQASPQYLHYSQLRVVANASQQPGTESANWSGYQVTAGPLAYTAVQGTWIVPSIAHSRTDTASSTWVGIGGGCANPPTCTEVEPTLIQAGTEQDNVSGARNYYAWWEALPGPSVPLSGGIITTGQSNDVAPGDVITVTISASPNVIWSLTIEDQRKGAAHWTFNTTVPYVAGGLTAEWIEESPTTAGSNGAGQLPLTHFKRVVFSGLEANGAPPTLTLNNEIVMTAGPGGKIIARPSAPRGDGFAVCFGRKPCRDGH